MARYTTQSYLENLFGRERLERLTSGGMGTVDADELTAAQEAADDEVDTYLQGVVDLPIPTDDVPRPLRLQAAKIVMWYLAGDSVTKGIQAKYESAISALRRIQSGKGGLGLEEDGDAADRAGSVQSQSGPPRRFGPQLDEYSHPSRS